jgi:hypothetical protein
LLATSLERLSRDLREVESRAYREAKEKVADAEQRIADAEAFIQRVGLDRAVSKIVSEIWHWPSHMRHPSHVFIRDKTLGLTDLTSEPKPETGKHRVDVSFALQPNGPRFRLSFQQDADPWYDMSSSLRFANFEVYVDGENVLALSLSHDLEKDREYHEYQVVSPSVLRHGPWIATLLELEHRIRMEEQARSTAWDIQYKTQLAAGLPPAETLPKEP